MSNFGYTLNGISLVIKNNASLNKIGAVFCDFKLPGTQKNPSLLGNVDSYIPLYRLGNAYLSTFLGIRSAVFRRALIKTKEEMQFIEFYISLLLSYLFEYQ